tara:strand:+ start:737 stop:901 length:165 start_codon:yes stop_codon:yes gene_type:complete
MKKRVIAQSKKLRNKLEMTSHMRRKEMFQSTNILKSIGLLIASMARYLSDFPEL